MRVAIIGAGVSGLVAAHLLQEEHELVVFEAADYAGGHANTIDVETEDGVLGVDTGFIVYNDRNYPNFERLLAELGVPTQPSEMSFGVSDGDGFEYNGASANGLFAQRSNLVRPSFHRLIADLLRFNREALELLQSDHDPSLREWLAQRRYSEGFVERLIVPQASAVWSADPEQMWTFPARFMLEFFDKHGVLGFRSRPQWRTVTGGSRVYVNAILDSLEAEVWLSTPVQSVARFGEHVAIRAGGSVHRFDAVVFATHSDQALSLLADPSDTERELLGAIPYQPNEAVLHTDRSLLPRRRRAWASWNYHVCEGEVGRPTVTYDMNRLQSLRSAEQLCVTLNRTEAIDPTKIIRRIQYAHPVYTREGVDAQGRVEEISGQRRTHYCGAYWGWGFHEDGVASGLRVAREIGAREALPLAA
jgi:uncharacterized protein